MNETKVVLIFNWQEYLVLWKRLVEAKDLERVRQELRMSRVDIRKLESQALRKLAAGVKGEEEWEENTGT